MKITNSQKIYIYCRENKKCFYCDKKLKFSQITLDHYLPKSKGGKDEIYNLVLCCKKCNRLKENFIPLNFEDTIIHLFKKAVSDKMIKRKGLTISNKELRRELLKVNRIESINNYFIFQSNNIRFYVLQNKVEKIVYIG